LLYEIRSSEIYVRIEKGRIEKNPLEKLRDYHPFLSSIFISLSSENDGIWSRSHHSNKIAIEAPSPLLGEYFDLSCLPEIQCYEFIIPVDSEIDLSKYWLTLTLQRAKNPNSAWWHAHNNFYSSSFILKE